MSENQTLQQELDEANRKLKLVSFSAHCNEKSVFSSYFYTILYLPLSFPCNMWVDLRIFKKTEMRIPAVALLALIVCFFNLLRVAAPSFIGRHCENIC